MLFLNSEYLDLDQIKKMVKSESLSEKVDCSEIRVSKFNGLSITVNNFNHYFNPIHFVYCRLKNWGVTKSSAMFWTGVYEKIYNPTNKCLKWISGLGYERRINRMGRLENL